MEIDPKLEEQQSRALVESLKAYGVSARAWFDTEWVAGGVWCIDWTVDSGYRIEMRRGHVSIWSPGGKPLTTTEVYEKPAEGETNDDDHADA